MKRGLRLGHGRADRGGRRESDANDELVGEPPHRHEDGTQLLDSRLLGERSIRERVALGLAYEVGEL